MDASGGATSGRHHRFDIGRESAVLSAAVVNGVASSIGGWVCMSTRRAFRRGCAFAPDSWWVEVMAFNIIASAFFYFDRSRQLTGLRARLVNSISNNNSKEQQRRRTRPGIFFALGWAMTI